MAPGPVGRRHLVTSHPSCNSKDASIQKEASEIDVGDIVFCQVQPSGLFYAHIVHEVQIQPPKYQIGNTEGHINGWCHREHIFGILIDVEVWSEGQYFSRPFPKELFEKVARLVQEDRWNDAACELCLPLPNPWGPEQQC